MRETNQNCIWLTIGCYYATEGIQSSVETLSVATGSKLLSFLINILEVLIKINENYKARKLIEIRS